MTAGNLTPPVATQYKPIQNATIFHFTDGNPLATANQFTAVVLLGDGSQVTLTGAWTVRPHRGQSRWRLRRAIVLHLHRRGREPDFQRYRE